MKWSEYIRKLKGAGYVFHKQLKGHDIYIHPKTHVRIMVERHGSQEIGDKLMHQLLKEAGLK